MAMTPEHESARGANKKVIITLVVIVVALYFASFFMLGG